MHPLIHLLNNCALASNTAQTEYTLAVLCDLSKAFDVIDHNILLHKLNLYGIRGVALEWVKDYLTDRKQYVRINQTDSLRKNILIGVPQGSILGPLLFLIYVNDIQYSCNANLLSFADDTTVYLNDSNYDRLFQTANSSMAANYSTGSVQTNCF